MASAKGFCKWFLEEKTANKHIFISLVVLPYSWLSVFRPTSCLFILSLVILQPIVWFQLHVRDGGFKITKFLQVLYKQMGSLERDNHKCPHIPLTKGKDVAWVHEVPGGREFPQGGRPQLAASPDTRVVSMCTFCFTCPLCASCQLATTTVNLGGPLFTCCINCLFSSKEMGSNVSSVAVFSLLMEFQSFSLCLRSLAVLLQEDKNLQR